MRPVLREKDLLAEIDRLKKIIDELKTSKPYGLVWEDKPEQFESDAENAVPVLKTKGGKFKDVELDPSSDHNVLIEGDNYHALSVLSYTHKGKIDVIYIDPPYNTGNEDFRYNDAFVEPDDIYRHSKWLSFMHKRLRLASDLLSEDGVLFISIDDNEAAPLKLLCDALFGERNFVGQFIIIRAEGGGLAKQYVKGHDYLLVYARNIASFTPLRREKDIRGTIITKDGREYWLEVDWLRRTFGKYGTLPYEEIEEVKGADKKREIDAGIASGIYQLIPIKNGKHVVARLRPLDEDGSKFYSVLKHLSAGGNEDLAKLGLASAFDFPKPLSLLKSLILGATFSDKKRRRIILDFFAGSGTTAHAVLELNKQDGGNRRFILCTNNENNICEDVTYERMKRVMKGYTTPAGEKVEGLGGNLKYLKTDFVKKELPVGLSDEAKLKLTHRANLLLSLKENTFTPVEATDYYEITASPNKITAVYFREDKTELTTMLDKLLDLSGNKPVTVYIFAWEKGAYKAGIPGYPFDFQDIPEPIVEVYQSIGY